MRHCNAPSEGILGSSVFIVPVYSYLPQKRKMIKLLSCSSPPLPVPGLKLQHFNPCLHGHVAFSPMYLCLLMVFLFSFKDTSHIGLRPILTTSS